MICLTDSFFGLAFSHENPRCSEDEEHQSREKGTNDNNGHGANGAISNQESAKRNQVSLLAFYTVLRDFV